MGGGHPCSFVTTDLDTLLTALYVEIDDHVIPTGRRGPGQPKRLSDAELVCLAVAQVLLGARSEHHWLRMCYGRLGQPATTSRHAWLPARIPAPEHPRRPAIAVRLWQGDRPDLPRPRQPR